MGPGAESTQSAHGEKVELPFWLQATLADAMGLDFEAPLAGSVAAGCRDLSELYSVALKQGDGSTQQNDTASSRVFTMLSAISEMLFKSREPNEPFGPMLTFTDGRRSAVLIDFRMHVELLADLADPARTLTKLIQRLQVPRLGRVMVDDVDLSTVDTASLRRQIGVVLQENILFSRTIRENIALADPVASMESIIKAAKLAGAHEFISELPGGYDTMVGEHCSTLSGGQRQRIAIARALLTEPRVLIFDEATSALDYESERAIQQNMAEICAGRTVLIIAHRLTAVRHAHKIVVFDRGKIVEQGTYADNAARPDGAFARLLQMQVDG